MKIIALVAAAAFLAFALNFTTGLNTLLDSTSIVFTAVPILASFVAVGFKRQGILVVADIALQVAIIGMLIGSVGLLQNMSDPKAVGPAFALTLSVVFYGLLIAGICSQLSSNISEPIAAPLAWQRVIGVLLWVVVVTYAMDGAAGVEAFIDPTSLLIVAALSLIIFGTSASEELKSLARYLPVAGFLGLLVGVIGMLQNMSNPKAIGPAMAIALLTLTYCNLVSVTLKLAFPETISQVRATHFTYLGFVLFFIMGIYSVLIFSFIWNTISVAIGFTWYSKTEYGTSVSNGRHWSGVLWGVAAIWASGVNNCMTFGTFYLLFLAVCTVFFSVTSEAIKDRFLINFADRIDNTALASAYLITTLAFIALGALIMQKIL